MTTYKFFPHLIIVFSDNESQVLKSDTQLLRVLSRLSDDFLKFSISLPPQSRLYYSNVFKIIQKIILLSRTHDIQSIIDMFRNLFAKVNRYYYPKFRIIFVNEI